MELLGRNMKGQTNPITAQAPATVANVGPGFDVLGFALAAPVVRVTVQRGGGGGLRIMSDVVLPTEPEKNTAGAAVIALQERLGNCDPLDIHITAGIPIGSGLGSSAASAVAAVVAAHRLLVGTLSDHALIDCALAGEAAVSGTRHADNVAPAFFGGIGIVRQHQPLDWIPLPISPTLHCVLVHPACVVETAAARRALPQQIPLTAAVQHWAQLAALVAGFYRGDLALIGRALRDEIIEPVRGAMIPGYAAVKEAAMTAGALGCTISGSGPTMLALTSDAATAAQVAAAMMAAFRAAGIASQQWVGPIALQGVRVVTG